MKNLKKLLLLLSCFQCSAEYLKWDSITDADFIAYIYKINNGPEIATTISTVDLGKLSEGVTYYFEVKAVYQNSTTSAPTSTSYSVPCNFTVSPTSFNFNDKGGSNKIKVTGVCPWYVSGTPSWITGSVSGGIYNFKVAKNDSKTGRNATFMVANKTIIVVQTGKKK